MNSAINCSLLPPLQHHQSPIFAVAVAINCLITFSTFPFIFIALKKLFSQSIIESSTRVFLAVILFFAGVHQFSYFIVKSRTLFKIIMQYPDPCDAYEYTYNCRFLLTGLVIGNSGLTFIQSAILIDRILSTFVQSYYGKLQLVTGIVMSVIAVLISASVNPILVFDDPLDDYVTNCGFYPPKSTARYTSFFRFCLLLSLIHAGIGTLIIRKNFRQQLIHHYDVIERYRNHENLKSTQSVFLLCISQFIFSCLFCGGMIVLFELHKRVTLATYAVVANSSYASVYSCFISPLLIIFMLKYIKNKRLRSIQVMTTTMETQEEHMEKIQKMWS